MSIREEEVVEKQTKKRKPLFLIIGIILVLLAVGGTAYYLAGGAGQASGGEAPLPELKSLSMEPFTVNLADMNYRRFLRVRITLEYADQGFPEQLAKYRYKVRDGIIDVLRSKAVEDIDTREKTENLRQEISHQVNQILDKKVENIYFEEFIIQ